MLKIYLQWKQKAKKLDKELALTNINTNTRYFIFK